MFSQNLLLFQKTACILILQNAYIVKVVLRSDNCPWVFDIKVIMYLQMRCYADMFVGCFREHPKFLVSANILYIECTMTDTCKAYWLTVVNEELLLRSVIRWCKVREHASCKHTTCWELTNTATQWLLFALSEKFMIQVSWLFFKLVLICCYFHFYKKSHSKQKS